MRVEYVIDRVNTRSWHLVRLDMKHDREDLTIKIPDGDPHQTITKIDRRSGITIMKAGHAQGDLGDASN